MRTNILLTVAVAAAVAAGGALVLHDRQATPPPPASNVVPLKSSLAASNNGVAPSESAATATAGVRTVSLPYYVIRDKGDDTVLAERSTELKVAGTPSQWRQARTAVGALAAFPQLSGTDHNPLPAGSRVLGVHVLNGIATVDMSPEFVSHFNGGAREEQMTIYALVNTVGRVPGVKGVTFSIAGKPVDEYAGHLDLSQPLTPDESLVEKAS